MGIFIQPCTFFISNRGYTAIHFNASIANGVCGKLQPQTQTTWPAFSLRSVGSCAPSRRQNRYKSIICQEDAYLKELVRYIHLNPLRARIVTDISELNNYTYCGHKVLLKKEKHPWQDSGCVLSYFGKSLREAQKGYLQYIESGIAQGRRPELVGGGLIRSLGGWQAVKDARFSGQGRMKGDHRILGDSAFVIGVGSGRREI